MKNKMRNCIIKIYKIILYVFGITKHILKKEFRKHNNRIIRVVNYHNVNKHEVNDFVKQIRYISRYYTFISYNAFKQIISGETITINNKKPLMLLTFDDGLQGNYSPLLDF